MRSGFWISLFQGGIEDERGFCEDEFVVLSFEREQGIGKGMDFFSY